MLRRRRTMLRRSEGRARLHSRTPRPYETSISRAEAMLAAPLAYLQHWMCEAALEENDTDMAYLLRLGVPPPNRGMWEEEGDTVLTESIINGHDLVGSLLYTYGASFYSAEFLMLTQRADWDDQAQADNLRRVLELDGFPLDPLLTRWLSHLPARNPEVASHRFLPEHGATALLPQLERGLGASVALSMPARPPHPRLFHVYPREVFEVIDDFRAGVVQLRCAWAKHKAPHHWHTLRVWARFRSAAFYWYGRMLQRVCAPGGPQCAADKRAYRRDFDWRPASKRRMLDDGFTEDESEQPAFRLYRYHSPPPVYSPTSPTYSPTSPTYSPTSPSDNPFNWNDVHASDDNAALLAGSFTPVHSPTYSPIYPPSPPNYSPTSLTWE